MNALIQVPTFVKTTNGEFINSSHICQLKLDNDKENVLKGKVIIGDELYMKSFDKNDVRQKLDICV